MSLFSKELREQLVSFSAAVLKVRLPPSLLVKYIHFSWNVCFNFSSTYYVRSYYFYYVHRKTNSNSTIPRFRIFTARLRKQLVSFTANVLEARLSPSLLVKYRYFYCTLWYDFSSSYATKLNSNHVKANSSNKWKKKRIIYIKYITQLIAIWHSPGPEILQRS